MSDNKKKPSIFQKALEAGEALLDAQIYKAKASTRINEDVGDSDDDFFSKAVIEDPSYSIHSQGFKEKPSRIQNSHLKQMSYHDSIIAAVIQTRQNQVANHAKPVKSEHEKGFMILLKNEEEELQKIKDEILKEREESGVVEEDQIAKAEPGETDADPEDESKVSQQSKSQDDDDVEEFDWELHRKAKERLEKKFSSAKKEVEDYLLNCGKLEDRPFESKKWSFEAALKAWVRDSLTYDLHATEVVPNNSLKPHYWFPIDASTVKYASGSLKKFKDLKETNFTNMDLLYPENSPEIKEARESKLELDQDLLEKNAYRYVQVVRGKIERAYTEDELKVGIRNANTDIYNNGYGISELELLVTLVTSHLNAEFYNQAYFIQGFSAKGILHIKKQLNRRKLEEVRMKWQHMVRGTKNSFQTPIFAGVEDVQWIPLTQNHNDIGFEGWMRYLVKMICAIYQIDPQEIGIALKDEGKGGGLSGDNTSHKIDLSKDKGLIPILQHFERHINNQIIGPFDPRFVIKFTGVTQESAKEAFDRQKEEVKFKKTVNEVRAEDGLPPLPGMDDVILDPNYIQWYTQYSKKAQEKQKMDAELNGQGQQDPNMFGEDPESIYNNDLLDASLNQEYNDNQDAADEAEKNKVQKSRLAKSLVKRIASRANNKRPPKRVKVEYYSTEE